ncbi:MAG: DUF4838 domain-containing protein [Armatimonadetes bacterium]|nr:DUF4838 domain-containing protein [Armatimonadota bacterium]
MNTIHLYRLSEEAPVQWAAAELSRILGRTTGAAVTVAAGPAPAGAPAIQVGTFADFPGRVTPRSSGHPFDDEIFIDAGPEGVLIAGVNPRSALLAAYRFLTELGCRWVRPGADGEYLPPIADPFARRIHLQETPSYRHRGLCIEGAVSWEHVRDLIDWLPKVGMSAYFVQFREAYQFFVRWYQHEFNPLMPKEPFTLEDARRYTRQIADEMRKRGLILHMVGHGWTCEPFGVAGLGWFAYTDPVPQSYYDICAEINGKRDLWGGIPLNTNLCYGNPAVRATMVRAIADYAAEHPEVDILHLWLADGSNNQCECPLCRDQIPADLYVKLCNEVDAELTARGLPTKIVFLIYVDLLWPPEKETLVNPDRFILMFAPITRTYTRSFTAAATGELPAIPPYTRNKLQFPSAPEANLAFLRGWQRMFQGDSFDFDYHLMWDHFRDPGYCALAKVLHQDLRGLRDLGLGGFNSCQVQRAFLPTGLLMAVMARTLWDRDVAYDAVADDLYQASFGPDWAKVRAYTERLSELFDPPFLRGERDEAGRQETARKVALVPATVEEFLPIIEANLGLADPCQAQSWRYLKEHAEICLALAPAVEAKAKGDAAATRAAALKLLEVVRRKEPVIHPVLDVTLFIRTLGGALGLSEEELAG